jgi:2-polyprenyl-6-methoxyphenol hydroxylase-like FAD-dependent oxidoreductase
MRADDVRVLIVGAGIAGLAAARTLHAWGGAVEIVERTPAPRTEGTGIYLPGNAVRALNSLGLGAQVAERAVRIERQRVADNRGRLLFEVDAADLWNGVGPCLALHRAELHGVLFAGAGDVPIRWGRTPHAVTVDDDAVSVEFGDGATNRYDLVLSADGPHSTVRRLAFRRSGATPGRAVRPPLRRRMAGPGAGVVGAARAGFLVLDDPDRPRTDVLLLRRTSR